MNYIKLSGPFSMYMPKEVNVDGLWEVEAKGQTVEDFIATTPAKDATMNYSVLINNKRKDKDYVLQDGDKLTILPLFYAG